ncbi:hypothetical protein N431DRAFT_450085 [Stipitochalara longipes BDJ]|nr:hypothetical protein N431DRAFT_450085 [Stipitochalara longipes BDJ]
MSTYGPNTVSGTTTYFLPLTTAFSAPSACSSLYLTDQIPASSGAAPGQMFAYDAKYQSVAGGGPLCMPTEVSLWWSQASSSQTTAVTELGGYTFNCPKQYSTFVSSGSNAATTTIGCCPSAYTLATFLPVGNPAQCYSVIPAGAITYLQPQPNTASTWTTTSSTFASPYTMYAVQVNGYIVPNPNSAAATSSSGSTSSPSNTPTTSSTQPPGSSSGISTGAKAGIGIAVALGVIGILALLGAWLLVRRKRQAYAVPPENTTYQHNEDVQQMAQPVEIGARKEHYNIPAAELDNEQPAVELDGRPHHD